MIINQANRDLIKVKICIVDKVIKKFMYRQRKKDKKAKEIKINFKGLKTLILNYQEANDNLIKRG